MAYAGRLDALQGIALAAGPLRMLHRLTDVSVLTGGFAPRCSRRYHQPECKAQSASGGAAPGLVELQNSGG